MTPSRDESLARAMRRVRGGEKPDNVVPLPKRSVSQRLASGFSRVEEPASTVWPAPAAGLVAAAWAAAMSLFTYGVIIVLGWVFAPLGDGGFGDAVRASAVTWLLADGGSVQWQGAVLSLPPLLATFGILLFQRRAGRWLAGAVAAEQPRDAAAVLVFAVAAAASFHVLIAVAAANEELIVAPWRNAAGAAMVAVIGFAWGILTTVPLRISAVVRTLVALGAALVGVSTLLVIIIGIVDRQAFIEVLNAVAGDTTSRIQVLVVCAAYVPTAVMWAMAVLLGPGISVGVGTQVSLTSVITGALPPVPLFALLPARGSATALFVVTALATAVTLRDVLSVRQRLAVVVGSGAMAGLVGIAASGGIGPERLSVVGPVWWQLALAGAAWPAAAFVISGIIGLVRQRMGRAAPDTEEPAT